MIEDPQVAQQLLQFLRTQNVAALATVREHKAHAATIFYYIDDDLKFYFLTRNGTLKFNELVKDSSVGLVITDAYTFQTVQVEGIAKEVDYVKEYNEVMRKYLNSILSRGKTWESIPLNQMIQSGYYAFVQVTPSWIRWTDFTNWSHGVKYEKRFL